VPKFSRDGLSGVIFARALKQLAIAWNGIGRRPYLRGAGYRQARASAFSSAGGCRAAGYYLWMILFDDPA